MLRQTLTRGIRLQAGTTTVTPSLSSPRHYASGVSEPKGNATGLAPGTSDGMKPGKDNTSKEPAYKQDPTPNVEGGEGTEDHPAKRPAPQPEPTRGTGIKGKEEMG